jgi:peptidyl-prolyl cis-trans isomerase SurA
MEYMKKSLFFLILLSGSVVAQVNDPVVMKINGKEVKKSEFEYIYNKNNNEEIIDKHSLDEYLVLFRNFKLKVAEAEAQGIDTTAAFHKELQEYRSQLAKPYLETEKKEALVSQAYDRANTWSEVSAILIPFSEEAKASVSRLTPADTLAAYRKALEVREKALKKGADFAALVKEYTADERSKQGDRPGYMGWFSGLNLIPALEMPLYTTGIGKVSMPVRTGGGYYLLKVHNKKTNPGEVHAAHILLKTPAETDALQAPDAETKWTEIYQKLKDGVDFGDLAKEYSDDPGSAANGGDLSWFQFGKMVPEFNEAVFAMTDTGSVSQPVQSPFGYHIIKLLGKRPGASFDDLRSQIETKMERTGNFADLHQPGIDQLKAAYGYSINQNTYRSLVEAANSQYPADSAFIARFENNTETLFTLANQPVTVADFMTYLKNNPQSYFNLSTEVLTEKLDQLIYQQLIDTEEKNLDGKYPEFRNLMQEYRDGILLFEVSNREVWDKASNDTIGLTAYFEANKSKYTWNEPHWKGYVVFVKDAKAKARMQKEIAKMTSDDAARYLLEKYNTADSIQIKVEKGLFTQGQNKYVDELIFKTGKPTELPKEYADFFLLGKYLPDTPESYTDVRGLVVTDYQDYLEQEWLEQLNRKYPVIIYKDVIEKEIK